MKFVSGQIVCVKLFRTIFALAKPLKQTIMNELPIVEGYVRLSLRSILIIAAILALNIMYFVLVGHLAIFLISMAVFIPFAAFVTIRNRIIGKPLVRIFEDRLETKFALQKEYRKYYFKDISKADMEYIFPDYEMVRLEFKDGRKPLKIKLSDLDAPVEILYRNIVERINL